MTPDEVMEPLIRLRREMEAVADANGVVMESFLVVPSEEGDNHIVQVLLHVEPKSAFATDEQRRFDDAFAEIAQNTAVEDAAAEVEARRDKLRQDIAQLKGGGIFPDSDE